MMRAWQQYADKSPAFGRYSTHRALKPKTLRTPMATMRLAHCISAALDSGLFRASFSVKWSHRIKRDARYSRPVDCAPRTWNLSWIGNADELLFMMPVDTFARRPQSIIDTCRWYKTSLTHATAAWSYIGPVCVRGSVKPVPVGRMPCNKLKDVVYLWE